MSKHGEYYLLNCKIEDILPSFDADSYDACFCDPPYAFKGGFMGKAWDKLDGREDAGFFYYLSGLIDGEGCFRVQRHERGSHTCAFSIHMRADDRTILELARSNLGIGTVTDGFGDAEKTRAMVKWNVQNKEDCLTLIGFLRKYPLRAKKYIDFEIWAEAVEEWCERPRGNRWIGASDQSKAAMYKEWIEKVRVFRSVPWSGHKFQDWTRQWAEHVYRVLKPGGMLLAFGGTKNFHRLVAGVEDAGFKLVDTLMWMHGQGFPKSHDIHKSTGDDNWIGYGTALKPSYEPLVLAMKPLAGTYAENALMHGVAGLNVDGCRIGTTVETWPKTRSFAAGISSGYTDWLEKGPTQSTGDAPAGRWPANLLLSHSPDCTETECVSDCAVRLLDEQSGITKSTDNIRKNSDFKSQSKGNEYAHETTGFSDRGGASRFFYCAKVSTRERNLGNIDCRHPTLKPLALCQYLATLILPPAHTDNSPRSLLVPFSGAGSEVLASLLAGWDEVTGIEQDEQYNEWAKARVAAGLSGEIGTPSTPTVRRTKQPVDLSRATTAAYEDGAADDALDAMDGDPYA